MVYLKSLPVTRNKSGYKVTNVGSKQQNRKISKVKRYYKYIVKVQSVTSVHFKIVHFSSVTQLCPNLCDPMNHSTSGLPVHHHPRSSLKLMSIEPVMPSSRLILCHPLFLLSPIPPSIRAFSNESTFRMRWPKYWGFSFSIIPSKEHLGLISFRMDWLDLLAVQGTLKSLHQHRSSKASILRCSVSS